MLGNRPMQLVCGRAGLELSWLCSVLFPSTLLSSLKTFQCHFKELTFLIIHCYERAWLICFSSVSEWKASRMYTIHLLVPVLIVLHLALFSYPLPPTCSPPPLQTLLSLETCAALPNLAWIQSKVTFGLMEFFHSAWFCPRVWKVGQLTGNSHPLPFQQVHVLLICGRIKK